MKKIHHPLLLLLCLMLIPSIPSTIHAKDLIWGGCGITKKAFMKELAKAYEKKTGTKIHIKGGGATYGIRAVGIGRIDIGGSCRHKLEEGGAFKGAVLEKKTKLIPVAWDALVVIVNKKNRLSNITTDQLKKVFLGKIKNWKQLGGPDKPIKVVIRKNKINGVSYMLRVMVFKDPQIDFTSDAIVKKSSGPLEKFIEKELYAIGISGISSAKKRKGLKFLSLDGISPSKKNIISGRYSLARPLYLTLGPNPSKEVKDFVKFALSDEGQAIISKQGTVSLKEGKSLAGAIK